MKICVTPNTFSRELLDLLLENLSEDDEIVFEEGVYNIYPSLEYNVNDIQLKQPQTNTYGPQKKGRGGKIKRW